MNLTSRFILFRLPVVLYAGLIFFLSSGPVASTELENIPDYYLHFSEYCLFYVAMFWAIHEGFRPLQGRGSYWLPAVLTILFGISDEFHQMFVPGRDASVLDILADSAGAAAGTVAALFINRFQGPVSDRAEP
jgi:VanZ family protein